MAWERSRDEDHDGWTRRLDDGLLLAGHGGWCFWPDGTDVVSDHGEAPGLVQAMEAADLWAAERSEGER